MDLQYYHLAYYSWDLALYAHLMWNLCHGSMSTSLFGGNFLMDHFNGIAFLLVPFYYFFQSALTLLYFKLFAFFAGAYVFYLLVNKRLGGLWGIAFMLGYIFYPANVTMLFFEFNFENLALPLIFLLFYFFEEKKFLCFMGTCFLLAIVKENMPLVVFMVGIYGFMERREDWLRWGLYPLLLGAGMFFIEVFVIIPYFRQGLGTGNAYWYLYSNLGHSPQEIFRTLITNEPKVLHLLFNNHNAVFLSKLFGPLLIAALMSWQILLIAFPLFLQNLLSSFSGQQSIDYFYSSTLTVFIFMAAINFLGRINLKAIRLTITFFVFIFLVIFDLKYIPQWRVRMVPFEEKQAAAQYLLSQIPQGAKVVSSYKFLDLLSQRKDLGILLHKRQEFLYQQDINPQIADYIIADFANRVDGKDAVKRVLANGLWKVQAAADEVVLLRKNRAQGEALIKFGNATYNHSSSYSHLSNYRHPERSEGSQEVLQMEGLEVPNSLKFDQRILPVVFYWKALKDDGNSNLPQVSLNILQGFGRFYLKNTAPLYGLPLKKGEYYRQVFYYLIPRLSPGNYKVAVTAQSGEYIQNITIEKPLE